MTGEGVHRLETGYNPYEQAGWFFRCSCGVWKEGLTVGQAAHEKSFHEKVLTAAGEACYRTSYEGNTGRREVTKMGFQAVTVEEIRNARSSLKGDGESWAKVTVQAFIDAGVDAGILGDEELKSRDGETTLKPESAAGMLATYLKGRSVLSGGSIPVVHLTQSFKDAEGNSAKRVILARTDTEAGAKVAGLKTTRKPKDATQDGAESTQEAPAAEGAELPDAQAEGTGDPFEQLENMGASA